MEVKYGIDSKTDIQETVTGQSDTRSPSAVQQSRAMSVSEARREYEERQPSIAYEKRFIEDFVDEEKDSEVRKNSFRQQIAAFLILEFGVIFHSVVIGLNLGVVGDEFSTLYPVLVFHQSFEGLGIGTRMLSMPFKPGSWLPRLLCTAYGLSLSLLGSVSEQLTIPILSPRTSSAAYWT